MNSRVTSQSTMQLIFPPFILFFFEFLWSRGVPRLRACSSAQRTEISPDKSRVGVWGLVCLGGCDCQVNVFSAVSQVCYSCQVNNSFFFSLPVHTLNPSIRTCPSRVWPPIRSPSWQAVAATITPAGSFPETNWEQEDSLTHMRT